MWCVPEIDREFIDRMEELLELYAKPEDASEPVVCLDERPVQLVDAERPGRRARPGKVAKCDYEYIRRGTANIFCIVEPRTGRHQTHVTPTRKGYRFARALQRVSKRHAKARTIHLVVRQPEHPRREVASSALRRSGWQAAVEAIHPALHTEARQLAQSRRDGSQSCKSRVPGRPPVR